MIVVVGSGPYGLSIAAHLRARRCEVRVFGSPMDAWIHNMPKGMFLKSTSRASSISAPQAGSTLNDYCARHDLGRLTDRDPVPIDVFVSYGRWFAEKHAPELEDMRVTGVAFAGSGFDVELDTGESVHADQVVVASGIVPFPYVPDELAALADETVSPDALCSHSSQHDDVAAFRGKDVALIGAGQSALEMAALIHEAGGAP